MAIAATLAHGLFLVGWAAREPLPTSPPTDSGSSAIWWLVLPLALALAVAVYQSRQNSQIAEPFAAQTSDASLARERATAFFLTKGWVPASDWLFTDEVSSLMFLPANSLGGDFAVEVTITRDGRVQAVFVSDGLATQSAIGGVIPIGPKQLVGGPEFLKLKRQLAALPW